MKHRPDPPVVLVAMPFAQFRQPSLALSLLKAELAQAGFPARVLYPSLDFAARIGAAVYDRIAAWYPADLLGDWIFARDLFGTRGDEDGYRDQVLRGGHPAHTQAWFGKQPLAAGDLAELDEVRDRVAGFLQDWTDWILALAPAVVGFTSQFHQHTAALALARRLKARRPGLFLVGGGPNFRGPMGREAVARFPFLDAVVSGEGDVVLPMLVDQVLSGATAAGLPGVFTPAAPEGPAEYAPVPEHLDDLPDPDTGDFDQAWAASALARDHAPRYLLETSRGCWWGARSRCLFCGQASARLDYRSKTAARAAEAFTTLGRAHPDAPLIVTDEIINPAFFRSLLPGLAHSGLGARIVYFEVRPDLDKTQLRALREAGTLRVEAGIESLSTPVLRLVRKGVTALQCLQFLKWCRELGLIPVWNWLWGFPGEPPEEYRRLARSLATVFHLAPPNYAGPFRLDRFSPYFQHPREHGLTGIAPYPAYRHVYPFPDEALERLAYYFTGRSAAPGREAGPYLEALSERIARWKVIHPRASLAFRDEGDRLVLRDHRDPDREAIFTALDGPHRRLYLACDRIRTAAQLDRLLRQEGRTAPAAEPVQDLLAPMVEQGWMAQEGDRYLALAIPRTDGPPATPWLQQAEPGVFPAGVGTNQQ